MEEYENNYWDMDLLLAFGLPTLAIAIIWFLSEKYGIDDDGGHGGLHP